ncbi:hypothetical protein RA272_28880, partial [Pseudomonas syringae pv. tagetis]|uniref:hypothetical protein n=1 Tax=Pseudomonas syringae group genomosp. 7 TaxID=251699 RepID=UPI00377051B6
NTAALGLYRKLGFEKVGERQGYYRQENGALSTALVMKRVLRLFPGSKMTCRPAQMPCGVVETRMSL